jgi:hypothetical protein
MIVSQNAETGFLGSGQGHDSMYQHGFGMLALAEAYGAVDDRMLWTEASAGGQQGRPLGQALELATRCAVTSARNNPLGGWRYSADAKDADTSVSGAVLMGLLAGYFGGWTETIIMRLTDIALAMPPLIMALAVAAVLEPSLMNAMLAIASLWWTWHTRMIYSITRQLRTKEFIEAAETLGASKFHILFREILPNCVSAIAVKTSLDCGFVILVGAALSFLGLGIQPPTPDLGTMVAQGASFLPDYWWESVLPGCAILFLALGFNLLGDGLRDLFDVEDVR